MKTVELESFLNEYLESYKFYDYCPNGLQVEASDKISSIAVGVSASMELFRKAKKYGADAVLVHHGLFWGSSSAPLKGVLAKRVGFLFENKINLFAYHLPLDAHKLVGNNKAIADILNLEQIKPFAKHGNTEIGVIGNLIRKTDIIELENILRTNFKHLNHTYLYGKRNIKKVAIVSGGAADDVYEAYEKGADLFITGEVSEQTQQWCKEAKINYIALGHYMSERYGVMRLAEVIKKKFGIKFKFIEVHNQA